MPLRNELNLAILDLISRNEPEPTQLSAPMPQADNLYPLCKHLFSARAQIYLETPTVHLVYQYNRPIEPKAALLSLLWKLLPAHQSIINDACADKSVGWVRDFDVVQFIGSTCDPQDVHLAVEKVVSIVNHFADKGFMNVTLAPLMMFRFAALPGVKSKLAVVSYISLSKEGIEYANTYAPKMMFPEGGVPNEVTSQ